MWSIPAALFLIAFLHRAAPGIIAKDLMQTFHATGAIVGLLSSTYFYGYAGLMVPAGLLIDAFGARWTIAAGSAVMGIGTLAMGAATAESALFAGRFVVGLGATVTFIGTLKIAAGWFPPSEFGTLSAITATVGVLGSLVGTYPLAALVTAAGWRGALGVLGVATVALALLCALVVRDRPPGAPEGAGGSPGWGLVLAGTARVLRNPHTWPPFLAFFFLYAATGNMLLWVVPCMRDVYGLDNTAAALFATAPSVALLASAPLTGYVSDHVLRRRKLPYTVLTTALFVLWVAFASGLGALPLWGVYAVLFGMGLAGGSFVLTWPLGREVNPPALAGIAVAVVNLGGFLGAALTQGPLGAVLDARWAGATLAGARVYPPAAYRATFAICAAFVLASALTTLAFKETHARNIHTPGVRP
jgi:MFS family permease